MSSQKATDLEDQPMRRLMKSSLHVEFQDRVARGWLPRGWGRGVRHDGGVARGQLVVHLYVLNVDGQVLSFFTGHKLHLQTSGTDTRPCYSIPPPLCCQGCGRSPSHL